MDRIKTIEILQNMVANAEGDEFIALRTAIDSVIQVKAFEEADRWIPCDVAMPEVHEHPEGWAESDNMLVCDVFSEMYTARWEVDSEFSKYWVFEDGAICDDVLAWQPLPKPYGGVK